MKPRLDPVCLAAWSFPFLFWGALAAWCWMTRTHR